MSRIILVSNRVMDLSKAEQAGGVAVALADVLRKSNGLWLGWSGTITKADDGPQGAATIKSQGEATIASLPLSPGEHAEYYLGYSNSVLWPVFHGRLDLARFEAGYYRRYLAVNARFAQALVPLINPDDIIWVHDYHLIPLGQELRRLGVRNRIGFFLHIPVPPAQTLLAIPEHKELAQAISAYNLVGLQTETDMRHFIDYMEHGVFGRILSDGHFRLFDRDISLASIPVGIDVNDFSYTAPRPPQPRDALQRDTGMPQRIIGVDRLDYSKGLPQKFRAFGRFLEKYPEYRGKVILSQIAPPTRSSVEAYADIRSELESMSGSINGRFGELDWVPIQYIHRATARKKLIEIYRKSRIGFVTPLRDGMNLVAKEYVAAQDPNDPGVLILSFFAGAAERMKSALIVNPYNIEEMADTIRRGLQMSLEERRERHSALMAEVCAKDTFSWAQTFLGMLAASGHLEETNGGTAPSGTITRALRNLQDAPLNSISR